MTHQMIHAIGKSLITLAIAVCALSLSSAAFKYAGTGEVDAVGVVSGIALPCLVYAVVKLAEISHRSEES